MPSTGRGKASKKERNDEALDRCAGNAGFAIEKLTEQQARENLACIQEAVDAAQ
jgi:hypothetical protein